MTLYLARRAVVALLVAVTGVFLLPSAPASAHPLGNFTVNTHVGLRVEPEAVAVRVVVDSAEIPTVQAFGATPPAPGSAEAVRYSEAECASMAEQLVVDVDGRRAALDVQSTALVFPPGAAGLVITRLTCDARTTEPVETVGTTIVVSGTPAQDRVGWHEVVAVGDGVTLPSSDVPTQSISDVLRAYPEDLLQSPLNQTGARLVVAEGSGVVSGGTTDDGRPSPSVPLDPLTERFTELVGSPDLTLLLAVLAFFGALFLGGLHAFAPGHGKALMAAYLVGQDGSWRQASLIGASVTVTHTAGVLVLGVVLSTLAVTTPERLYPWLGLASGVLVCGIGTTLLRRAVARRRADDAPARHGDEHDHDDSPDHAHDHDHEHDREPAHTHVGTAVAAPPVPHRHGTGPVHSHAVATDARGLLAVGFAGGLVPAPSAVVVLLGGIALGRAWFGVLLVLAYGIGMAIALAGTGLLLVHARRRVQRWAVAPGGAAWGGAAFSWLPVAAAAFVVAVGIGLTVRALLQM